MRTSNRITGPLAGAALAVALLFPGAVSAERELRPIPLEWRPAIELGDLGPIDLSGITGVRIEVAPLEDRRPDPGSIGERLSGTEGAEPMPVTSSHDVAAFVTGRMIHLLETMGLTVVPRGGTAVLAGEVQRFFVREGALYEGEVVLKLTLRDPGGEAQWQGSVRGGASRYGMPGQPATYQEALSDALFEAVHRLVEDPEVARALQGLAP